MKKIWLPTAIAVFALVACDADVTAPSTTDIATSQSKPPPVRIENATLAQALGLAVGQLARIDEDEVEVIERGMHCSLDSVNGAPASEGMASEEVRLSGWFEHPEAQAQDVVAVLRGAETFAFRATDSGARPDIARMVKRPHISDLLATASLAGVPLGEYKVYFVRSGPEGLAKCVADTAVTIK